MKPNFALDLADDSITLLRRGVEGWQIVGQTPFDTPDLPQALTALRQKAEALAPEGIATKLVIPNSQILYAEVEAQGPSEQERQAQIGLALEGLTPYKAEELAFDYTKTGDQILVAAVALETLQEAESFAQANGFNPVSFVANPKNAFRFEPWLGRTLFADSFLPEGESIERDFELLEIEEPTQEATYLTIPSVVAEAPQLLDDGLTLSIPNPDHSTDHEPPLEIQVFAEAPDAKIEAPAEQDFTLTIKAPVQDTPAPEARDVFAALPPAGAPFPLDIRPLAAGSSDEAPFADVKDPILEAEAALQSAQIAKDDDAATPERRIRIDRESRSGSRLAPSLWLDELPEEELPQKTPSSVLLRALAARRDAAPPSGVNAPPPQRLRVDQSFAQQDIAPEPSTISAFTFEPNASINDAFDDGPMTLTFAPPPLSASDSVFAAPSATLAAETSQELIAPETAQAALDESLEAAPIAPAEKTADESPTPKPAQDIQIAAPQAPKVLLDQPELNLPAFDTIADRLGENLAPAQKPALSAPPILGAPEPLGRTLSIKAPLKAELKSAPEASKPSKLKAAFFKSGKMAAAKAETLAQAAEKTTPKVDAEKLKASKLKFAEAKAKAQQPRNDAAQAAAESLSKSPFTPAERGKPRHLGLILTALLIVALAAVAAWSAFTSDAPIEEQSQSSEQAMAPSSDGQALPETLPPNAIVTQPLSSASETAQLPPTDEIRVAAADSPPASGEAQGLPQPGAQTEAPPENPMPPPAFGTVYERDAEGLLIPQVNGILTPEGFMLYAGKPKTLPEPRPDSIEAAARAALPEADPPPAPLLPEAAAPDQASNPPAEEAADNAAQPNPDLIRIKPRARPEGLAPPAQDDAALEEPASAPIQQAAFDGPRPLARPATILASAELARDQSAAASLLATSSPDQPLQVEDGSNGLTISLRPAPRPRNFAPPVGAVAVASVSAPAVDAAVNAAMQQSAPQRTAPQRASTQEEEDELDEPETPRNAPKIPTKANVAKQATETKVINLSKLNLIGIYGANSNRYAMVRTKNGKFTKVKVGDKLDGGRVQAITQTEVRYQKGGNLLALAMPKG